MRGGRRDVRDRRKEWEKYWREENLRARSSRLFEKGKNGQEGDKKTEGGYAYPLSAPHLWAYAFYISRISLSR